MEEGYNMLSTMMVLKDLGIATIRVDYSGSGDSGQIDDITFISKSEAVNVPSDIKSKVEAYAYNLLNDVEDWYNNEGGWGNIDINVEENTYHIDNNIRIEQYEHYGHDGEINLD